MVLLCYHCTIMEEKEEKEEPTVLFLLGLETCKGQQGDL